MLAARVAARFLSKVADSYGDPADLLRKYREELASYAKHEDTAKEWLHAYAEIERLRAQGPETRAEQDRLRGTMYSTPSYGGKVDKAGGPLGAVQYNGRSGELAGVAQKLCYAILQHLALPANIRKAIETSARWWGKGVRIPKGPSREETQAKGIEVYFEHLGIFRKYEKLYEEAIRLGKAHSAEGEGATRMPAGPFTVVNTGGFDADLMDYCAKLVAEAAHKMTAIGLGSVCYGDVLMSNRLMRQKNVGAFYSPQQDEMFIRPNRMDGALRIVCHELTHRHVAKHLRGRQHEIDALYEAVKATGSFVTSYAKTGGPEENFCEMVASYAIGKLPKDQVDLIQPLL